MLKVAVIRIVIGVMRVIKLVTKEVGRMFNMNMSVAIRVRIVMKGVAVRV